MGSFDNARDVGHDERMVIAALDDTQVGFERREGIVGDLGLCGGNDRKKRAFARIREPPQSYVGQHLQFENESSLLTILTGLRITRSLVGRGLEMPVSQSAPATLEQDELFAVGGHLSGIFRRTVLEHPSGDRSQRYGDNDVLAVLTRRAGPGTAFAVLRELVTLVLKVNQRPVLAVAAQDDMSSATAVAAVRSAEFDEFLAAEMRRPAAAVSGTGEYFHVIYKVRRFSADDDTRHDLLQTGIYRCKDSASREECQIYLDTSEAGSLQNAVENRKQDRFIENSGSKKALPSILQMVQITVTHKVTWRYM